MQEDKFWELLFVCFPGRRNGSKIAASNEYTHFCAPVFEEVGRGILLLARPSFVTLYVMLHNS